MRGGMMISAPVRSGPGGSRAQMRGGRRPGSAAGRPHDGSCRRGSGRSHCRRTGISSCRAHGGRPRHMAPCGAERRRFGTGCAGAQHGPRRPSSRRRPQRGRFHAGSARTQGGRLRAAGPRRGNNARSAGGKIRGPVSRRSHARMLGRTGRGMHDARPLRGRRNHAAVRRQRSRRRRRHDDGRPVRRRNNDGRREHGKDERGAVIGMGPPGSRAYADTAAVKAPRSYGDAAGYIRSVGIGGAAGKGENGKKGEKTKLHDSLPERSPAGEWGCRAKVAPHRPPVSPERTRDEKGGEIPPLLIKS